MTKAPPPAAAASLSALADQCVMCGLCLPHCPTYNLANEEAESPRGRIALARGLIDGRIEPTATAVRHLDQCLTCLNCQTICPSGVRYGEIIVKTREWLFDRRAGDTRSILRRVLRNPRLLVALARAAERVRAARWLPGLARRLLPDGSALRRIVTTLPLPTPPPAWIGRSARKNTGARGRVALFTGCVASVFDRDTHVAATRLLARLGYDVVIPDRTQCCGALAAHAGDHAAAASEARRTRDALIASGAKIALVSASGCFGSLRDLALAGSDIRAVDILAFIVDDAELAALRFSPLPKVAALHLPCTQINVAGGGSAVRSLLARIPDLDMRAVPNQPGCCGAAGSYFLEQPAIADQLRESKLDHVGALDAVMLLTTNIGCRIHLGNGLRQRGKLLPVLHPITLLANQLLDE
ncbi:MAG: heterodisulfide reductase-related iron-sulfur binding cluster [Dokdonella sp.]